MCVAILKGKNKRISRAELTDAWNSNPDGGGLAWSEGGKLHVFKSFDKDGKMMNRDEFVDIAVKLQTKYLSENMLIHFRIATQGEVNERNCHPFIVNKDVVFIHNGVIRDVPHSNEVSDTRYFNRLYLRALPFKFGDEHSPVFGARGINKLIEDRIGWSKLIFLNSGGEFEIVNEDSGTWKRGNWFSNLNHCRMTRTFKFSNALKPTSQRELDL